MSKIELKKKIDKLMEEWANYCHRPQSPWTDSIFVKDGAFPFYEQQEPKILFIARELYGKQNKEDGLCINYWDERAGMDNLGVFQSRLLYLAYGIINGQCTLQDWLNMQEAKELDNSFAKSNETTETKTFSYAFMNASKILNIQGTQIGDTFQGFINDPENLKFIIEEIRLLNPNIIVSANLGDLGLMRKLMTFNNSIKQKEADKLLNNENRFIYWFDDKIPWIDTWHFSAHKDHFKGFYEPVCEAAKILLG